MVKRMTFLVPHEQTPEQRAIRALFAKIGLAIRKVSIEVDFEYLISGDEYYFLDTYDPKVLYLFPEDVSDERVRTSIGMRKSSTSLILPTAIRYTAVPNSRLGPVSKLTGSLSYTLFNIPDKQVILQRLDQPTLAPILPALLQLKIPSRILPGRFDTYLVYGKFNLSRIFVQPPPLSRPTPLPPSSVAA